MILQASMDNIDQNVMLHVSVKSKIAQTFPPFQTTRKLTFKQILHCVSSVTGWGFAKNQITLHIKEKG